ncbi:MAG: DUF2304 domain-containing protein [Syntrophorhabdaceae bacterium]|nr:DUF2304 domain-containing protein [Syntrophorhabdales bacterium]MBP9560597.1 DUF2304 domain-containing protein [Syntrophorhabdaceae bacterium]
MLHMQLIIGLISIGFFIVTFEFIRKRYLREEYAILWLLTSLAIALLSLWPGLIEIISRITGFYYITAILIVIFVFLIAILMHYSIVISKMKEMNKELVQQYALLEYKVRELEEKNSLQ